MHSLPHTKRPPDQRTVHREPRAISPARAVPAAHACWKARSPTADVVFEASTKVGRVLGVFDALRPSWPALFLPHLAQAAAVLSEAYHCQEPPVTHGPRTQTRRPSPSRR
eukprot:scaffold266_cov391-Prasinococcus_capsulatus_cf.AAC.12